MRSAFFIDGFNLYHALDRLRRDELKWLDLMALMRLQIAPRDEDVVSVFYFTAYPTWHPQKWVRHRAYVAALEAVGVQAVIGHFKHKPMRCRSCGSEWQKPEEKETDVNIALALLNEAYRDTYDRAYLVSRDSDLKPAVAMVRAYFPRKEVYAIAPPRHGHSVDLLDVVNGKKKIRVSQLEQCLFGELVVDGGGNIVAERPAQYAPPAG